MPKKGDRAAGGKAKAKPQKGSASGGAKAKGELPGVVDAKAKLHPRAKCSDASVGQKATTGEALESGLGGRGGQGHGGKGGCVGGGGGSSSRAGDAAIAATGSGAGARHSNALSDGTVRSMTAWPATVIGESASTGGHEGRSVDKKERCFQISTLVRTQPLSHSSSNRSSSSSSTSRPPQKKRRGSQTNQAGPPVPGSSVSRVLDERPGNTEAGRARAGSMGWRGRVTRAGEGVSVRICTFVFREDRREVPQIRLLWGPLGTTGGRLHTLLFNGTHYDVVTLTQEQLDMLGL